MNFLAAMLIMLAVYVQVVNSHAITIAIYKKVAYKTGPLNVASLILATAGLAILFL